MVNSHKSQPQKTGHDHALGHQCMMAILPLMLLGTPIPHAKAQSIADEQGITHENVQLSDTIIQSMACIPVRGFPLQNSNPFYRPLLYLKMMEHQIASNIIGKTLIEANAEHKIKQCIAGSLHTQNRDPVGQFYPTKGMIALSLKAHDDLNKKYPLFFTHQVFTYSLAEEYFHSWQYTQQPELMIGAYSPLYTLFRNRAQEVQAKIASIIITAAVFGNNFIRNSAKIYDAAPGELGSFIGKKLSQCMGVEENQQTSFSPQCLNATFRQAMLYEDTYYQTTPHPNTASNRQIAHGKLAQFYGQFPGLQINFLQPDTVDDILSKLAKRNPKPN